MFLPDDSPAIAALAAVLERRLATTHPRFPPLPHGLVVARRVVPAIATSGPGLDHQLLAFVESLGEPYRSQVDRLRRRVAWTSTLSLDEAEVCLGAWLVGGLGGETAIFDDDPQAGWDFATELVLTVDEPNGTTRYHKAVDLFDRAESSAALFAVSPESVTLIYVLGSN
jgi:hypothetical protein